MKIPTMKLKILDNLAPEDGAMLQALYSRSPASVEDHLPKVEERGSGSFFERFYLGYGHKSIGDCGTTTIFIEGVTMLIAKAIQDWPLYSGQEASTRYMDFSQAVFLDPVGTQASAAIQERWRTFYLEAQEPVRDHLLRTYLRQEGEDEKVYERAIKARTFDILRSFLPAGATTNLSWHTNLRQASDHLLELAHHPDPICNDVARAIHWRLRETYPNSFKPLPPHVERDPYRAMAMQTHYYLRPDEARETPKVWPEFKQTHLLPGGALGLLHHRPRGVEIPRQFAEYGVICSQFQLDYGSFRDLQRHRNGTVRMPLLTTKLGFHPWYLESLPVVACAQAYKLLQEQEAAVEALDCPDEVAQNYIAMGYQVPCRVTQSLPAFVYRLELRSSKTVHPTLRQVVHEEIRQFREHFPDIPLHVDMDEDSWTIRRGKQTIEERP